MICTNGINAVLYWMYIIIPQATELDLDPRVVAAIVAVESQGNKCAYSTLKNEDGTVEKLAIGLMGVVPFGHKIEWLEVPENNINVGCHRLRFGIEQTGSVRRALIAYHVGLEGARRLGYEQSLDGQNYISMFTEAWYELFGNGTPLPWSTRPMREPEE